MKIAEVDTHYNEIEEEIAPLQRVIDTNQSECGKYRLAIVSKEFPRHTFLHHDWIQTREKSPTENEFRANMEKQIKMWQEANGIVREITAEIAYWRTVSRPAITPK